MEPSQAQRADGNITLAGEERWQRQEREEGQQRRMCSGRRGHGKSKMPLPEARRMESKSWAGVSWDASPQKLQREERENRRMVGCSCLRSHCTAGILIPHHHPKAGLRCASPFWVQDAPPCSARHETAAWCTVSTAAETILQAKGRFQEERRSWEPLGEDLR